MSGVWGGEGGRASRLGLNGGRVAPPADWYSGRMRAVLNILAWILGCAAVIALAVILPGPLPEPPAGAGPVIISLGFAIGGAPFTVCPLLLAWGLGALANRAGKLAGPSLTTRTMKYLTIGSAVSLLARPFFG